MRTSFITASLVTIAALIFAGNLSRACAASDTDAQGLASHALTRISYYQCTGVFEKYGPRTFCAEMREQTPNSNGFFSFIEDKLLVHACTYEAKGNPPNTQFGVSTNFFCHGLNTGTAQVGQVMGKTITGQAYWLNVVGGVRSAFTCERVATCP